MTDATMTSPALKQMRKSWHKGTFLWHTGLYLLLISLIIQFIVIGTTEFIVGEGPITVDPLPLYTSIRRSYGMWRSCYDVNGLAIPKSLEQIGCVRPESKCSDIMSLFELIQAFGVLGVVFTSLGVLVQIGGIARRGSCFITMLVSLIVGFLAMGFTLTIWAVVVGLKRFEFCSGAFQVLPDIELMGYKYGASFTIAVIDWIILMLYLFNQLILAGVIRSHSKSITEQVDAPADENASAPVEQKAE